MSFVKSATTSVGVSRSKNDLENMLRRYGAEAFSVTHDYVGGRAQVSFRIPDSKAKGAEQVPVRIPVNVQAVYHALYGRPTKRYGTEYDPKGYDARKMEQAERVAWRNLILWVDAALSTASIGLQTITETFFAHAVIGANGETAMQLTMMDSTRLLAAPTPPPRTEQ